jgi:DUF1365 family protein
VTFASALIRGEVVHARRDVHAQRTFTYSVYVAAIDLDELPALDRELHLFSRGRFNLFGLDERDYAAAGRDLRGAHAELLAQHGLARPERVVLVTNPRVLGYTFNPVSFFLGYAADGSLASVVAEVNNTYGGRHSYVMGPGQRVVGPRAVTYRMPRELFVSPFLHGHATYDFVFEAPLGGDLAITMHVATAAGDRVFTATLRGQRRELTDGSLLRAALRYPIMTAQVIGLIHYEALKLHLRRVPYRRPGADHRPIVEPASITTAPK